MKLIRNTRQLEVLTGEVKEAFSGTGLHLISCISVDTSEFEYHVPAEEARVTTSIFCDTQRQFITQLRLNESVTEYGTCDYWSLVLYIGCISPCFEWSIPTYYESELPVLSIKGFKHCGWSSFGDTVASGLFEQEDTSNLLPVGDLKSEVLKVRDFFEAISLPTPFRSIQATGMSPSYSFKNCDHAYWKQFNFKAAAHYINHLWGM